MTAALAAAMLAVGVGVGAAIGPAPTASFAGDTPALVAQAALGAGGARAHGRAAGEQPAAVPKRPPKRRRALALASRREHDARGRRARRNPGRRLAELGNGKTATKRKPDAGAKSKVPAVTNVWLIELSGPSYEELLAQKRAAPYISGQLIPTGTLLSGWSAIEGSAFASEAALAAPSSAGATPPIVHSIVQPPCPEGAAGESCSTPAGALHGGRRIRAGHAAADHRHAPPSANTASRS